MSERLFSKKWASIRGVGALALSFHSFSAYAVAAPETPTRSVAPNGSCGALLEGGIWAAAKNLFAESARAHSPALIQDVLKEFAAPRPQGAERFDGLLAALARQPEKLTDEIIYAHILFEMRLMAENKDVAAKLDQLIEQNIPSLARLLVESAMQAKDQALQKRAVAVIEAGIRAGMKAELEKGNAIPNLLFLNRLYVVSNKLDVFEEFHDLLKREFAGDRYAPIVRDALTESVNMVAFIEVDDGRDGRQKILASIFGEKEDKGRGIEVERSNKKLFSRLSAEKNLNADILARSKEEVFKYIQVTKGSFKVGSPATEAGRYDDEAQRDITLTYDFEMQATPVTQLQWYLVMGTTPSRFKEARFADAPDEFAALGDGLLINHPVEMVSWEEAQMFIARLNSLDRYYNYRLPYEVEWEVAARAGTTTAYFKGDDPSILGEIAWFFGNSGKRTHAVGMKQVNAWGFADMHGNVCEWMQDRHVSNPAGGVDPKGPREGSSRVLHGGSWDDSPQSLRSAYRLKLLPTLHYGYVGFRPVRIPK